jgi:hypothetical protein
MSPASVLTLVSMRKSMTTYRAGYDYVPSDTLRAPIPDLPKYALRSSPTPARPHAALIMIGLVLLLGIGLIYVATLTTHRTLTTMNRV